MATKGDRNMQEVYGDYNVIDIYFHMHLLVLFS
jgi:hypothetical protein